MPMYDRFGNAERPSVFDYDERVKFLKENGYVTLEDAIDHRLLDVFWADVEKHLSTNPELQFSLNEQILKNADVQGRLVHNNTTLRMIDLDQHSPVIPWVMLHSTIQDFLLKYLGNPPTVLQTLTYKYSSEQGAHSDLYLVEPYWVGPAYKRSSMIAAWIACEDSDEQNGALILYPRSHLLTKKRLEEFSNSDEYPEYLVELCKLNGIKPKIFNAKKGDVLFWHGDFVHAGGKIFDRSLTRKSLVVHYADVTENSGFRGPPRHRMDFGHGRWYYIAPRLAGAESLLPSGAAHVSRSSPPTNVEDLGSMIEGAFDGFEEGAAVGWARNATDPDGRVIVRVYIDGEPFADATADLERPDVKAAGIGDGRYGFRVALPKASMDGAEHRVSVRETRSGAELVSTSRMLCAAR